MYWTNPCLILYILILQDLLIESSELDKVRPSYEAILLIFLQDEQDPLSIPCKGIHVD